MLVAKSATEIGDESKSDQELMQFYLNGDSSAFNSLYKRHGSKVFSYLYRKTQGQRDLTEELHQAVFLKFHQSRLLYDSKYPVLQWLYVIARTTLLDHFRKLGRQVVEDTDVSLENIAEPRPELSQERDFSTLGQLTEEQRKAVELRYLDDRTYAEIAEKLGKSQESVRQIVSRALRKLKGSPKRSKL